MGFRIFMNIIFFGTSEFAVPVLKALLTTPYSLLSVVTVPDQPSGRKRVMTPPPAKLAADKLGLTILQPASLKDDQFFEAFKSLNPDLCVVAAYGKIIPQRYLEIPPHGFINIHPSLLPKYRGPTPVQSAILNGDKDTGVTIMIVDKDMDHGAILAQVKSEISKVESYKELHDRLALIGAQLLVKSIPGYINGDIKPQEQDHSQATFCKMYTREDAKIDWSKPGEQIFNQIRALNPEPGTWTTWNNKSLNIKSAALLSTHYSLLTTHSPGTVAIMDNEIVVATGTKNCYIALKVIQLEGKRDTDPQSFVSGYPGFLNSILR